jgi:hypothetical protein
MWLWKVYIASFSSSLSVLPAHSEGRHFAPPDAPSTLGPEAMEPTNHGLQPLKLWAKNKSFLPKVVYLTYFLTAVKISLIQRLKYLRKSKINLQSKQKIKVKVKTWMSTWKKSYWKSIRKGLIFILLQGPQ